MKTEMLLVNRETGTVHEISSCATSISYSTERTGSPGTLQFTFVRSGNITLNHGDVIRFTVDGILIFFGWVFSISTDRWGISDVTCYDRLRYLKANASYAFYAQTAGGIIQQIAEDFQLSLGTIADTGYAIPSLIAEDQSCLDTIGDAVQQTLLNTGKIYVFYDDGNGLALQEAGSMVSNVVIGDESLLTDFTYKSSIDDQTYNFIKLVRPNEDTGRADVVVAQDSSTIAEWGLLQLYQTVDGETNTAQMEAQAQTSLQYYNRPMNTFQISALGVPGIRAGQIVYMQISRIPALANGAYVLLESVSHSFSNDQHTMDIETLTI